MFRNAMTAIADLGPEWREPKPTSLIAFMANETTTTTLDDVTNVNLVQPTLILALREQPGLFKMCREFDVRNQGATSFKVPVQHTYWGTPNDRGAGVATAFDGPGQMTAAPYTSVTTDGVTCTPAEYVIAHGVSDNVQEDTVQGIDLMSLFTSTMTIVLALALDDDYVAQFANLSQLVGSTGVTITLVQLIAAQQGLRVRGANADAWAYVLDNVQAANMESAFMATGTSMAVFALAADRLIGYTPTSDQGMGPTRQIASVRSAPVYASGLLDTANAGVDVNGACICPSTANNDKTGATTHGMFIKRLPTVEMQRQALKRGTDVVLSARMGFVELQDGSGTLIQTKST